MATVLGNLKNLINQVDDNGGCSSPCSPQCSPLDFPFLQVCMMEPACTLAPTAPQYVKPLALPNINPPPPPPRDPEADFISRKSNFYNYHNVDYRKTGRELDPPPNPRQRPKEKYCEDYKAQKDGSSKGCPTGFKPCEMRLCPPPCCNPLGTWTATVMPCPIKRTVPDNRYVPGPCTRPCCLHWYPKGGFCKYDAPCKAHCYDHPPGIKPSGRTC
ncbi:hypothetical protein RN001_011646 [Aquatica leii]|uniref:Uncharacterized protein n=1 Tax=Aquatica leii TaxID=1421715 RepID=A0AAN7PS13_9COLE|nr:hypothetical protein RN001_011646 [Aquatica leii]